MDRTGTILLSDGRNGMVNVHMIRSFNGEGLTLLAGSDHQLTARLAVMLIEGGLAEVVPQWPPQTETR